MAVVTYLKAISDALREEMELHIAETAAPLQDDGMVRNAPGRKRGADSGKLD